MKSKWLRNTMTVALTVIIGLTLATDNAFARRSGGGFSSSRSSSSRSSGSRSSGGFGSSRSSSSKSKPTVSKPKTVKPAKALPPRKTATQIKAEKAKVASVTKTNADAKKFKSLDTKSPAYSKTDTMLQKNIGKSGKTFNTRTAAKSDMTSKMATKKYTHADSKTAMTSKPSYVPATRSVGGNTYNTTYVGGQYGYMGSSGSFIAYLAADMIVTDMMLHSHGYRPVHRTIPVTTTHDHSSPTVLVVILCGIALVVIVGVTEHLN